MILCITVIIVMLFFETVLRLRGAGRMSGGKLFGALSHFVCGFGTSGLGKQDLRERQERTALLFTVFFFVNVLAAAVEIKERISAEDLSGGTILREEAGEDSREVVLEAEAPGISEEIEYEIGARKLTDEETEKLLDKAEKEIEAAIPGEGGSLSHVSGDLVLLRSACGGEVKVSWDVWNAGLVDLYGKVEEDADIPDEGIDIYLTANLTTQGHKRTKEFTVRLFRDDRALTFKEKALKELEKHDAGSAEGKAMKLPDKVDGVPVSWSLKGSGTGRLILVTGIMAAGLMPLLWQERRRKKAKQAEEELREDYPEFAHELILYLDCGMGIENAAALIVKDMDRNGQAEHRLCRELKACLSEINNGGPRDRVWEDFGRKCGLREYIRIGAFMSQFIKTGAGNFRETLEDTAREAAAMQSGIIRRRSETAGTRLLGPMILLLMVVMAAVIFPALYSISF